MEAQQMTADVAAVRGLSFNSPSDHDMRIQYDHQVFSLQNAGGASRYHYELLRYLRTVSDVRTELVLGLNGVKLPFNELSAPETRVWGLRSSLGAGKYRYIANEAFGNLIALWQGRADVYHPTLYRNLPMVRARRIVVTHHDCAHERYPELFPTGKRILSAKKRQFAQADAIICVSESSRRDLLDFYGVDPSKARVIHHGLTKLAGSTAASAYLKKLTRREFLLFVGSRAPYKNFNNLLRAIHESHMDRSFDLLVLGGGALTDTESDLVSKLGLTGSIVFIPEADDALLAESYRAALLFVYPSLYEGFGFPPLEAMACGCPVLASNTSSIPEVSCDAPFYFDPSDPGALCASLVQASTDDEARKRAVKRGLQVAAQYSWDKCGKETLSLYRECQ
jgi:glycosyltransferase involved in cell wall biosynthesis